MNCLDGHLDSGHEALTRSVCSADDQPVAKFREKVMKAFTPTLVKVLSDEQGGEVLEYALIAGLIIVAALAVIGSVGTKVLARWGSLNSSM